MNEELTFDLSIEDFLYQKFLLQICKICDDIYSEEKRPVGIPFIEKQRMAEEMLDFIGYALNNLKGSLLKIEKPKDWNKKLKEFTKSLSNKAERDRFSKFVLFNYILEKKVPVKRVPSCLAFATLVLLAKGEPLNFEKLEEKVKRVKPFTVRIAALISPFIDLHGKLQKEIKKGNIKLERVLRKGKIDKEALRYIG